MCVIFRFSSHGSEKSEKISGEPIKKVAESVSEEFRKLPEKKKKEVLDPYHKALRKTAHVVEYAVLGMLAYIAFLQHKKKKIILSATTLCAFYAITDEIHQLFVKGRACRWYDVLIDTGGSLIGIGILIWILKKKKECFK